MVVDMTAIEARSPQECPVRTPAHEHAWSVESSHATSIGQVLYVRCVGCGARRVDLGGAPFVPPTALSTEVSPND